MKGKEPTCCLNYKACIVAYRYCHDHFVKATKIAFQSSFFISRLTMPPHMYKLIYGIGCISGEHKTGPHAV